MVTARSRGRLKRQKTEGRSLGRPACWPSCDGSHWSGEHWPWGTIDINQCNTAQPVVSPMFAQQICLPLILSSSYGSKLNQHAAIVHSLVHIQRRMIQSYAVHIRFFTNAHFSLMHIKRRSRKALKESVQSWRLHLKNPKSKIKKKKTSRRMDRCCRHIPVGRLRHDGRAP